MVDAGDVEADRPGGADRHLAVVGVDDVGEVDGGKRAHGLPPRALGVILTGHGVVGRRGELQNIADRLDPVVGLIGVDELDDQRCGRSSSAAKKADADLRIELARRSSRFSCSRALTRSDSSVDTPPVRPSSMSAWRTHARTDSTP